MALLFSTCCSQSYDHLFFRARAGNKPMTIRKMVLLSLYIFIGRIESKWKPLAERRLSPPPLSERGGGCGGRRRGAIGPRCLHRQPRTLQIRRRGRYEKCTIKPFEISIVIMSCLLSLESRVTFHTEESRGSLRREKNQIVKRNMQRISLCRRSLRLQISFVYPIEIVSIWGRQVRRDEWQAFPPTETWLTS